MVYQWSCPSQNMQAGFATSRMVIECRFRLITSAASDILFRPVEVVLKNLGLFRFFLKQ